MSAAPLEVERPRRARESGPATIDRAPCPSELLTGIDLLAAFSRVASARWDAHLVLVGDGELRAEVIAAVGRAGLDGG